MAVSDFILTKQVKCINNENDTNNENVPLVNVNNDDIPPPLVNNFNDGIMVISEQEQDMVKTLTGGDTIRVRDFYDNIYLYSSFEEFVKIIY